MKTPKVIAFLLAAIVLLGGLSVMDSLHAQQQRKAKSAESFTRPKPKQPIKPEIPGINRYQDDKVFLENADSLFRPPLDMEEKQIVKGSVVFRQGGMWMYCDSAYYFPERNSLNAFGNVEMRQGDTLFVYADKLYYDGGERHAILTAGPSRREVTLKDPKVTLTTDSLDYDMNTEIGWYTRGGRLEDDLNVLTSVYGEYSPKSKIARFSNDVVLVNTRDDFRMLTNELEYNTDTHIATINTETRIEGANDTILTTGGRYNTQTDNAVLTERSTILHRDSSMNVVSLEGDSIIYDKATRLSRAFMFTDPDKNPRPMVLTDTARKMTLIGGYGEYDDSLQRAYSTKYPLLIEYSRPDSLFLRADTILTYIRTEYVWPDSLAKGWSAETRARLLAYGSAEELANDLRIDLPLLPYRFAKAGNAGKLLGFDEGFFKRLENMKKAAANAAASGNATAPGKGIAGKLALKGKDEKSIDMDANMDKDKDKDKDTDTNGKLSLLKGKIQDRPGEQTEAADSVAQDSLEVTEIVVPDSLEVTEIVVPDSLEITEIVVPDSLEITEIETDSMIAARQMQDTLLMPVEEIDTVPAGPRLDALGRDSAYMVPKEFHVARAIGRARFFRQDLQGVADTMIYQEFDSMLYLIRKPIVWSDERQIYGDKINVHFNDSTVDRADLPETGFLAEHIGEEFYNQLSGKKMTAHFENDELRNMLVEGNVETIFLPMENDSTYNKLVNAESSFLSIDMKDRTLQKLKFWPETTGSMTPIFLIKPAQLYLQGFKWFDILRPKREWYGDRWKWIDELGEVPEALDAYFKDDTPARKSK